MIEWISIKDKLPLYGQPVLIVRNSVVQNVTYMRDGSDITEDWFEPYHFEDQEASIWISEVTHWMPLPTPPEN